MTRWNEDGVRQAVLRGPLFAVALVLLGCTSPGPGRDSGAVVKVVFGSSDLGKTPAGFTPALTGGGGPVSWVVRPDPTAPSGTGRALVQESADATSYRFPTCVYDALVARDVAAEVRFKPISGELDQVAGIVLRYGPESYYVARAQAVNSNLVLFKTVRGNRIRLKEVEAKVTPGEWHTLRFEVRGSRLKVRYDGRDLIELEDSTVSEPGNVGVWTKADSVTAFDELAIEPLDPPGTHFAPAKPERAPPPCPDLVAAFARAKGSNRPLLILVTDSGTPTTERVHGLLKSPRVHAELESVELVELDLDNSRARATALGLHVEEAPAGLGLSSQGLVVARDEKVASEDTLIALLGETRRRAAALDSELASLEGRVAAKPGDVGPRRALASFLLAHEGWREAIPHLDVLAGAEASPTPERVRAYVEIARAYFSTDDPEKGRRTAKTLLAKLGPTSPEARAAAHLLLGVRDGELGRTATALEELDQAIRDAPESDFAKEAREARSRLNGSSN
jgi:hypothetical protein